MEGRPRLKPIQVRPRDGRALQEKKGARAEAASSEARGEWQDRAIHDIPHWQQLRSLEESLSS